MNQELSTATYYKSGRRWVVAQHGREICRTSSKRNAQHIANGLTANEALATAQNKIALLENTLESRVTPLGERIGRLFSGKK